MSIKKVVKSSTHTQYVCDICGKPIIVATWIFQRNPYKQKTHYHIDCLIAFADKHAKKKAD